MVAELFAPLKKLTYNKDLLTAGSTVPETSLVIPKDLLQTRGYPGDEDSVEDLKGNGQQGYPTVVGAHREISSFGDYGDDTFLRSSTQ